MKKPSLPIWLDRKIIATETNLRNNNIHVSSTKVIKYLNALRHGDVKFSTEAVIHIKTAQVLYWEYLLRVKDTDGTDLLTGSVLETLNKWNILPLVGEYLIEMALIQSIKHGCSVGLNVPPQLFMSEKFRTRLYARLEKAKHSGVVPHQVFLEILETPDMNIGHDMQDMFTWMNNITKQGYSIGLDDFGAPDGLHTFEHIKKLPISFLKLDGAVINSMLNGTFNEEPYKNMFEYCKINNIDIIAEHVENIADAHMLSRKYPITHIQSRNVQPEDFA